MQSNDTDMSCSRNAANRCELHYIEVCSYLMQFYNSWSYKIANIEGNEYGQRLVRVTKLSAKSERYVICVLCSYQIGYNKNMKRIVLRNYKGI